MAVLANISAQAENLLNSLERAAGGINLYVNADKMESVSKLATIVEGDPKAPFSIATTPRCRGGRYSIPWIAPLYPWTVPYNAEC